MPLGRLRCGLEVGPPVARPQRQGDRKGYVQALVGLEQLRRQSPLLALGATDGPLVARARRVLSEPDREAASPRLAAGVIALSVAVLAIAGVSTASQEPARSEAPNRLSQTSAAVPVITVSPQGGSLAERWAWSEREARNRRTSRYWVGHSFRPVRGLPPVVYFDRDVRIAGGGMYFNGHILGNAGNLIFPGRPLDIREMDARAIKVLFALDVSGPTPRLTRVHASAAPAPVDLRELPVFWLGAAETAQSLERVDDMYSRASTPDLKKDLIAAITIHDDSARVVAWLERRLAGSDPDEIRAEAAEGLAHHPIKAALVALDRTARNDTASQVRQEAAEALGDLKMPEATDTLISLVRRPQDVETRREAVEALGTRADQKARDALGDIATQDTNRDIQREAIESLGEHPDAQALGLVRKLAQEHPDPEVRRQAVETLAEHLAPSETIAMLRQVIESDRDVEVRRDAVEQLAEVGDQRARTMLVELARSHKDVEVRAEAVESLGDAPSEADTANVLGGIVRNDPDERVREEALETLADLPDGRGIPALVEIARSHADQQIRRAWNR